MRSARPQPRRRPLGDARTASVPALAECSSSTLELEGSLGDARTASGRALAAGGVEPVELEGPLGDARIASGRALAGLGALLAVAVWASVSACSACRGSDAELAGSDGSSRTSSASASRSRGLVLGSIDEPDTLDPMFIEISGAAEIVRLLFYDFTAFDETWSVVPQLAAELPKAETSTGSAQIVRWHLRPGLAWSDGHPLTARDVELGFRIASDPTLDVTSKQMTAEIASVTAVSDLEVRVVWRRPYSSYDAPRTHPILPAHAYPDPKTSPRPFRGLGRTPISCGPYRLAEWVPGQYIRLEQNPYWTGHKPELPSITWRFFGREDAFEVELKSGGIDALGEASGLSLERAAGLEERLAKTHVVQYTDSGLFLHLEVRSDHPALGDVRVRRAISRAIDRDAMARVVYGGKATAAYSAFPPRHRAYREVKDTPVDVALAEKLLDEAGYTKDPKTGIRAKLNVKLELELQFASGTQASERAAAFLRAELAKIGIDVTLSALPTRVVFAKMRERSHAPLVLFAWRTSPDWDAYAMLHSKGAQNYGGLADAELDRLLDDAKGQASAPALGNVEARYRELLPSIPLLFRKAVTVRPRGLEGWRPTGTQTPVTWNAEMWRWSDNNQ